MAETLADKAPRNRFEMPLGDGFGAIGDAPRRARFDETDGCPECMIGRLVLIVGVLYAAGIAWILLPGELIIHSLRQL